MIKFLGGQEATPYENTEVDTYTAPAYCYRVIICIYNLTDDETFELWDSSKLIFATYRKQK